MKTANKIYAAVAVLALGAGGLYLSRMDGQKPVAAASSPAPSSRTASSPPPTETLPVIAVSKGDAARVTQIELTSPDDDDKSRLQTITIERRGHDWELTTPLVTTASTSKVEALIDNLQMLHLWKLVDPGTSFYDQYDLTETKAVHIVVRAGALTLVELFCGKGSADGQLVRLPGRDGIFSLVNWGPESYAGFLFTRDLRSWRETTIFNFQEDAVVEVEITNRSGVLLFSRDSSQPAGRWRGTRTRRLAGGRLGRPERVWAGFDETKVGELLRAYHALGADDFAVGISRAESGVDEAERTGGVVRITVRNAGADPKQTTPLILKVGKLSNSHTRWAIKDSRWAIKDGGDGTLYALSPWTADWARADAGKFERAPGPPPSR